MNTIEIVEEYQSRSHAARAYREIAVLLLVVSVIVWALYGINRAQLGAWGGVVLAAGIVIGAATFALAALSIIKLRCPNCDRVLGEVHGAAYCPSCGAALKSEAVIHINAPAAPKRGGSGRAMAKRAAGTSVGRVWEPGSRTPGIDDFPEEAYPKNIRMFTTPNEMELTKRYIQLIDKDNRKDPMPARMLGRAAKSTRNVLPEKASGGESEITGVRRPHGILGSLSIESIIAIIAGSIILAAIVIALIGTLG
ncbi:MAG: zinc ribbon domain-containing protein [Anaerolineales bacterium]|nr:zinc ribbon domain-containing protein [Anaerolineales bacterium]